MCVCVCVYVHSSLGKVLSSFSKVAVVKLEENQDRDRWFATGLLSLSLSPVQCVDSVSEKISLRPPAHLCDELWNTVWLVVACSHETTSTQFVDALLERANVFIPKRR